MMFYTANAVIVALFACLWVSIYSNEEIRPRDRSVVNVFVLHKNDTFGEVDMNGTRYAYTEDRRIDFIPNEWRNLHLIPIYKKNNLRGDNTIVGPAVSFWKSEDDTKICEYAKKFISEAFARCIGSVSDIRLVNPSFQPNVQNRLLVEFDYWYDNKFTGFIRYSLNLLHNKNKTDALFISVIDNNNEEHLYQLSIANNTNDVAAIIPSAYLRRRLSI